MRINTFTVDLTKGLSFISLFGLQALQVIWKLLDTFSGAAVELEKEGFEKEIFQQLKESSPDHKYDLVSRANIYLLILYVQSSQRRILMFHFTEKRTRILDRAKNNERMSVNFFMRFYVC